MKDKLGKGKHNWKGKEEDTYFFDCPGCGFAHSFKTTGDEPKWTFNGDLINPTVSPSIRIQAKELCHIFIRNGQIQFLNDCTHNLKGQTINMINWFPEMNTFIKKENMKDTTYVLKSGAGYYIGHEMSTVFRPNMTSDINEAKILDRTKALLFKVSFISIGLEVEIIKHERI